MSQSNPRTHPLSPEEQRELTRLLQVERAPAPAPAPAASPPDAPDDDDQELLKLLLLGVLDDEEAP